MKKIFLLTAVCLCLLSFGLLYSGSVSQDLSENLLRMHIIANSNSNIDQSAKLCVRDEILKNISSFSTLSDIDAVANECLLNQGTDYRARTSVEYCYVPKKEYKNISLPEGMYTCLRVTLGNGSGENWWCVAYPPLCFTEEVFGELTPQGEALLKNQLSHEAFRTIVNTGKVNLRFKLLEEAQRIIDALASI